MLEVLVNFSIFELFFVGLMFVSLLMYLHFFIGYSWNENQLHLVSEENSYHLKLFSLWGSVVALLTIACVFISANDQYLFTGIIVLLLISVVFARFYYFKGVTKLLKIKRLDKFYKYLMYIYLAACTYFIFAAFKQGHSVIFDTTRPSDIQNTLRKTIIPYELNSFVKILFAPNYIFCQISFVYITFKALKRKDFLIGFGAIFTMLSILYTNSYHFFHWKYWAPLNVVADLFELFRLNYMQKIEIQRSLVDKNSRINELEQTNLEHRVFKHDLANKLTSTYFNVKRAAKLAKNSKDNEEVKTRLEKAVEAQELITSFFHGKDVVEEINLNQMAGQLSGLLGVKVILENDSHTKLVFNRKDLINILINLIKNAKEANSNCPDCWVKVKLLADEDNYSFWVTDSGLYEKIEDKEKIFDTGFSSKEGSDRGLGLYSVRTLINKYDGEIKLTKNDVNTCFAFNIKNR